MNKKEHIAWWLESARHDWRAVKNMMKSKDYVHALFFSHLVLEKLFKAHWIKDNEGNHPPKIHNLQFLLSRTKLKPDQKEIDFLGQMNSFQLEGRYPEYKTNIYKTYRLKESKPIIEKTDTIRKWLIQKIS